MLLLLLFFFNDTATTEIYTLSLHDALPISPPRCGPGRQHLRAAVLLLPRPRQRLPGGGGRRRGHDDRRLRSGDRKSTRLNSSHANISYAVFCLKKKKMTSTTIIQAVRTNYP